MINKKQTLQEMIQSKITEEDWKKADEDTHGFVKIIISATMKEKAYDFLYSMMKEERKKYTLDLFEKIEDTPWYDFKQPNGSRFILIWLLETVADEEEIIEYFQETLQEYDQDYGDIIIDSTFKNQKEKTVRLLTHNRAIETITILD